jgi:glycosyltransferase A (GT-A) superfamily protein (DUF2064 family)
VPADLFVAPEPPEAKQEMRALVAGSARAFAQEGDTLGDRMRHTFEQLFARGYSSVAMIGSDLPTLPSSYVQRAFDDLRNRNAVVVGPATDGGYYLIGLRPNSPALFEQIPWGTREVLAKTL